MLTKALLALGCALVSLAPAWAIPPGARDTDARQSGTPIQVVDDWQRSVRLPAAPRRIVSLAPHATELLFAVGAGPRVVAVDRNSDQPPEVARLPRLTSFPRPDPERLLALHPDLVVLWGPGADRDLVARLQALGLAVFVSEPQGLSGIASSLERFAHFAEDPRAGLALARRFDEQVAGLRARYSGRSPVPVFVQAWTRPLITLSDRDGFADALRTCGAWNVFGEERMAAPQVSPEAVIRRAPWLVIGFRGSFGEGGHEPWTRLGMFAPQGPFAYASVEDSIQRPTARVLEPLAKLCEAIDEVRRSHR